MIGILAFCASIAVLISLGLNDIQCNKEKERSFKLFRKNYFILLYLNLILIFNLYIVKNQGNELVDQFFQLNQVFLIPMIILNGLILSFLWLDFTRVRPLAFYLLFKTLINTY